MEACPSISLCDNRPMPATVDQLTDQALILPEEERAELAHRILLSLENGADEGVTQAWEAEIEGRVTRIRRGDAIGRPAEDVFRKIRSRHQ